MSDFLENIWYMAGPARRLKPGRTLAKTIAGIDLMFGRTDQGEVFALRDACPHRAMPLSEGRFDGAEIECCYHGWRFDASGQCTAIPSLVNGRVRDISRIAVPAYPCREQEGLIWIFLGEETPETPPPPQTSDMGNRAPALTHAVPLPVHADHGIIGLMDPAHGAFVHRSWWWRTKKSLRHKKKRFEPIALGFRQPRHQASPNSLIFKLLGGRVDAEIRFILPGIRVETLYLGKARFVGVTAVTPIDAENCEFQHAIYWNSPWIGLFRWPLAYFMHAFLNQDRVAFAKQRKGLRQGTPLMLINDADAQAKWYYALKKEHADALAAGRPFRNPVKETTLEWYS